MKRYDSYKDSGVEWLGNIPSSWNKIKLKHKGDVIIGLSYKPDDVVNENEGTLVMRSSNIQNGKPTFNDNVYVKTEISDKLTTKEGDILICSRNGSRRLIGKNCLITKDIEGMTWGVFMTMYRSPHSKYMYWLLNSPIFKSQSGLFLTSTINQLTVSTLENMVLPFTENVDEQQQIVSFLDTKTSLIDSLIEKTQQKIELLKEKRTTLINEVVTKGLNPNVEMKDSGVEWIGEIPSHWTIQPIKYLKSDKKDSIVDGPFGSSVNVNEDYGEFEIPVVRTTNITDKGFRDEDLRFMKKEKYQQLIRHNVLPNDVLFSKVGTIGNVCLFPEKYKEGILSTTGSCRIRLNESKVNRYWFIYVLLKHKKQFNFLSGQNVQPFLNMTTIKDVKLEFPPISEQQQIVDYLNEQTQLIDKTISIEEKRIELLKEYRQSLISEVVTGKRKVV